MSISVAAVQFASTTDKCRNLKELEALVSRAADQGARLVVAPEFAMHPSSENQELLSEIAEPLDGPFASAMSDLARLTKVVLVVGLIESSLEGSRPSNSVIALDSGGEHLGVYRKLHLYDAFGVTESERFRRGSHGAPLTFTVGGLKFGVMTCYDLRFPEMGRFLVDNGADALVLPSAWVAGPQKEDHWLTLLRARAIENTSYVIGAGQTGPRYTGRSVIVDPMGIVVADAGDESGIIVGSVSAKRIERVRAVLPSLAHRRFKVVPQ